ncbi:hypothetical protein ACWKWP_07720 [Agromyces soli]
MRFVFAIVAFIAAAVLIGLGIAQRTVFLEPDRVALQTAIDTEADYIVIDPDALAAHPGKQTISVLGDGTVFVAYGRSSDVDAWVRADDHAVVGYDAKTGELVVDEVAGEAPATSDEAADASTEATPAEPPAEEAAETDAAPAASPAGSDLWLDELTGDASVIATVDVPEGISVIVASGSEDPVPDEVAITWPLDNATPWAGPLLVSGTVLFIVGLVLLLSGVLNHRRSRGPRRNLPKGPRGMPARRKLARSASGGSSSGAGRRAFLAPLVLVPALALSACSADYWPSFDGGSEASETATATPTPSAEAGEAADDETDAVPAVTEPQMERIMREISAFATDADAARSSEVLDQRFTGPALEARTADYVIRGSLPDQTQAVAIPPGPLSVMLPQQTAADPETGWPRTVLTVIESGSDEAAAPTALVLQQESPREQYHVLYTVSLAPGPEFPDVAPASVGAPLIAPDYKGLVLAPSQVSAAFADVLMKGADSEFAKYFDLDATELDDKLNATNRTNEVQGANPTISLSVSAAAGDEPVVALATNDAGALVTTTVTRTEQSRPNDGGTTGFQDGSPARALSGFTAQSAKGVQSTRDLQLLFYVPAVGSDEPIRLLGWSESLVSASEVP